VRTPLDRNDDFLLYPTLLSIQMLDDIFADLYAQNSGQIIMRCLLLEPLPYIYHACFLNQ
jgi:hypothetical protein